MHIEETKEETERLRSLSEDKDEKIAFLAQYIRKIIYAADDEETYKREQGERNA